MTNKYLEKIAEHHASIDPYGDLHLAYPVAATGDNVISRLHIAIPRTSNRDNGKGKPSKQELNDMAFDRLCLKYGI